MGHKWQYTQMRRVHLLGLHSQSTFPQAAHSSGSSSQDSVLMCMHLSHIIQLVLRLTPTWHLNSLTNRVVMPWWHDCCSSWILYAALIQTEPETCCLPGFVKCYLTQFCSTKSHWMRHSRLSFPTECLFDKCKTRAKIYLYTIYKSHPAQGIHFINSKSTQN